jgi:hypothetical protein
MILGKQVCNIMLYLAYLLPMQYYDAARKKKRENPTPPPNKRNSLPLGPTNMH